MRAVLEGLAARRGVRRLDDDAEDRLFLAVRPAGPGEIGGCHSSSSTTDFTWWCVGSGGGFWGGLATEAERSAGGGGAVSAAVFRASWRGRRRRWRSISSCWRGSCGAMQDGGRSGRCEQHILSTATDLVRFCAAEIDAAGGG